MSLPVGVGTCTVTATYDDLGGNPAVGSVMFETGFQLIDAPDKVIITGNSYAAKLVAGVLGITIPYTDNPNVNPSGFGYWVTEQIPGGQRYFIELPRSLGPTVDLATLVRSPVPSHPVFASAPFALLSGATFTGPVAGPDPTADNQFATRGWVTAHGGSGGGAVASVNGHTGVVVLGAADVAAVPAATVTSKGDLIAATAAGAVAHLPAGTDGQLLAADSTAGTGLRWTAAPSSAVASVNGHTGVVVLGAADVAAVPAATVTSKGDLIAGTGPGAVARMAVGADGQLLAADSTTADGLSWTTPPAFRGTWVNSTAYRVGDTVTSGERAYVAVAAGTGRNPTTVTQFFTATPATPDSGDGGAYELGITVTPAADLRLSGIAFYKAPANTGTHTGRLWQLGKNGVYYVVNQVTFTGETASGWQSAPLWADLSAGSTYILSYSVPNGHYSLDPHTFDTPVTVGSITAPTGAGMYSTTTGHVPENVSGTNPSYGIAPIWGEPATAWWAETGDWQVLPGFPSAAESAAAFLLAEIGVPGGVAALDGTSHLLVANLPPTVIQNTMVTAKGDLIAGTAAGAVARLPAGADGQVLAANSAAADGLSWVNPGAGLWVPSDTGLVAATADPHSITGGITLTAGTIYLDALFVTAAAAVTHLLWGIATAGITPTAGGNWVALVDPAGTVVASVNVDARVTTTGLFTETFATVNLSAGIYRAAFLFNAATPPLVYGALAAGADVANAGIASPAGLTCATNGAGAASMPSAFTLSANAATAAAPFAAIK